MLQLLHPVEGGACLEPLNLRLVEAVIEFQRLLAAFAVLQNGLKRLLAKVTRRREDIVILITAKSGDAICQIDCPLTFPGVKFLSPLMEILSSGRILS